jgi:hypothetical protein
MPSIRIGPYRVSFYSSDEHEPKHVHVVRDQKQVKFWLDPIRLAKNKGFAAHELTRIERLLEHLRDERSQAWDDYFTPKPD